jgi:hypothetical protein
MSNVEQRLHELRELAKKYAKAKAECTYLNEFRKSKLAILMKKASAYHDTNAAQDREARSDPEYLELLKGLRVATEESEKLRWELEIAKMGAELWRTEQSTKRAEMQGYR